MADSTTSTDNQLIQSTDYLIKQLVIYSLSTGQAVDVSALMLELNLYDSIFTPSVSGNVILQDSLGLIEKIPLTGNETINMLLEKPGSDGAIKFEKSFRIYKLSDRKAKTNLNEVYTLHFCSYQQVFSEQIRLSKGYTYKNVTYMVNDILQNELQVPNDAKYFIESTYGNMNLSVPNLTPLQTCTWLAKRALNSNKIPSYLFFESLNDGYIFSSLETLFDTFDTKLEYTHNIQTADGTQEAEKLFGVNYSETEQGFNIITGIQNGVYASTNYGIDLVTLSFEKTVFDYQQYQTKTAKLNNKINKTEFLDNQGKSVSMKNLANIKITPLTKNQLTNPYIKAHDKTVFSNDMDEIVSQRQHIFQNLLNSKIYLTVPGFNSLSSGRVIKVKFLDRNTRDKTDTDETDDLYSGRYLIVRCRHVFRPDGVYRTYMECATDSYKEVGK
jgi:hypothetical protein